MREAQSDNLIRIYPDKIPPKENSGFNSGKLMIALAKSLLTEQITRRVKGGWKRKLLVSISVYSALTAVESIIENRRSVMQNLETIDRREL